MLLVVVSKGKEEGIKEPVFLYLVASGFAVCLRVWGSSREFWPSGLPVSKYDCVGNLTYCKVFSFYSELNMVP